MMSTNVKVVVIQYAFWFGTYMQVSAQIINVTKVHHTVLFNKHYLPGFVSMVIKSVWTPMLKTLVFQRKSSYSTCIKV